jgi:hypothetical protein
MKPITRLFLTAASLAALMVGTVAQTQTAANVTPDGNSPAPAALARAASAVAEAQPPVTAADLAELRAALAAQQREIEALREELRRRDEALQPPAPISTAPENPAIGLTPATPAEPTAAISRVAAPADSAISQSPTAPSNQVYDPQMEGPLTLHFRGINITPGGYAEGAFVRHSRALGADLPTPYNSVPMPEASQSHVSEFFGSGRQSKITGFVDGRLKNVDFSSYVSADFLSAGVTSTSTQTNSYTLRLRQAWGQAKFDGGWAVLAGQAWSLATENGRGISPDDDLGRTNDARPRVVDPSYNVGFVYARQYGLRVTKSFGDKVAFAVAIENPEATLTTHGNANNYLLGENGASNSYNTAATYSFNPSPDVIVKAAFDPGFGHYEIFALADRFADRVFPCVEFATGSPQCTATGATSATGAYNASKEGGGLGGSARWKIANHVTLGFKGFGGSGVGRYGPAGLSDASINPDGTLHLIKNLMGLGTLEFRVTKKLEINTYGGVEYAARAYGFDPLAKSGAGAQVGYGAPTFVNTGCFTETSPTGGFSPGTLANCTADSRAVIEGTAGFWYRFYSGDRGSFRFGTQYSYLTRNTWSGVGGAPHGIDNMIFTSFRYYLP